MQVEEISLNFKEEKKKIGMAWSLELKTDEALQETILDMLQELCPKFKARILTEEAYQTLIRLGKKDV